MTSPLTEQQTPDTPHNRMSGPIHGHFSLSYCNYQVLNRTLMQCMPLAWQERMVACLDELHAAFEHVPQAEGFHVEAATEHEVSDLDEAQRSQLGITEDWYRGETPPEGLSDADLAEWEAEHEDSDGPVYHRDGEEIGGSDRVLLPAVDPVPHYRRAPYIEPKLPCPRCKGSGVDPESVSEERYGDVTRELPEPCSACQVSAIDHRASV